MNVLAIVQLLATVLAGHAADGTAPHSAVTDALAKGLALLNAYEGLKSGLVPVTSVDNVLTDFQAAVGALQGSGIDLKLPAGVENFEKDVTKFASVRHDFETGQAALIGTFPYSNAAAGVPAGSIGDVWATLRGGPGEAALQQ